MQLLLEDVMFSELFVIMLYLQIQLELTHVDGYANN